MFTIQKNKDLTTLNTFAFTAEAELYSRITAESDLVEALAYIKNNQISYQVLSGGSNLLIAAQVPGLTLHLQIKGIRLIAETEKQVILRVSAGENWHQLVKYTVNNHWQGIETLALIPGLVGASAVQNIGAYGAEVQDVLLKLRAFDTQLASFVEFDNQQCEFGYRDSLFKRHPGRYIITSIDIQLSKIHQIKQHYKALANYFSDKKITDVGLKDIFEAVCDVRKMKLPDPQDVPNAGSFFKNPSIPLAAFKRLKSNHPDIIGYPLPEAKIKVAAGWLIDDCGWRGYHAKGVGVYPKQALVLIHTGGATLAQLLTLAEEIKLSVYHKFSITLEIEPQHFPMPLNNQ